VERALDLELREAGADGPSRGARAHLRAYARALDKAEAAEDLAATAKVGREYLEGRRAYGLAGGGETPLDPFSAFVAGLSTPDLGNASHN
jgi:hypothetical protein